MYSASSSAIISAQHLAQHDHLLGLRRTRSDGRTRALRRGAVDAGLRWIGVRQWEDIGGLHQQRRVLVAVTAGPRLHLQGTLHTEMFVWLCPAVQFRAPLA